MLIEEREWLVGITLEVKLQLAEIISIDQAATSVAGK